MYSHKDKRNKKFPTLCYMLRAIILRLYNFVEFDERTHGNSVEWGQYNHDTIGDPINQANSTQLKYRDRQKK